MRLVGVVLILAALLLAGGIILNASGSHRRLVGSNRVVANGYPVTLTAARPTACQPATVPAGAGAVRLTLSASSGQRPPLRLRFAGRTATLPGGASIYAVLPVRTGFAGQLCVTARTRRPVGIAGSPVPRSQGARSRPGGRPQPALMRLEYLTRDPRTWWSRLGELWRAFGWGKAAWQGSWILGLCGLLALAALGLAAFTLIRSVRES